MKAYEGNFFVGLFNSVYNLAPMSKTGLSVVPFIALMNGKPTPDKVDLGTSGALAASGWLWFVYCLIVWPRVWGNVVLANVNGAMALVNSVNVYRRLNYELTHNKKPKSP